MEIKVSKGRNGWEAESYLSLNDKQQLRIQTSRFGSPADGRIDTTASVLTVENGILTHVFNSGFGRGDFMERLIVRTAARVTEKTVREQHQEAIANLENLKVHIAQHYAAQAAKQQKRSVQLAQAA